MKTFLRIILVMTFISINVQNFLANDMNVSFFKGYFTSNNYEKHIDGLINIQKNSSELKGNSDIINLVINEIIETQNKSLDFLAADDEKFNKVLMTAVETLGYIGTIKEVTKILNIINKEKRNDVMKSGIYAVSLITDNEKYEVSIAFVKFFSKFDYQKIKDDEELCFTIIETLCILTENKPLDIVDYIGLLGVFKVFTNKSVFPSVVADYSKRKLLDIMIKQM